MGLHDHHHHHSHRAGQQQQQQELRQPLPPHPLAFYPQIFFAGLVCMLLGQLVEVGMPVKLMGAKVFDLRPPRRSLKRTAAAVTWNCSVLKRQHSFNCCFSSWDFFFSFLFFLFFNQSNFLPLQSLQSENVTCQFQGSNNFIFKILCKWPSQTQQPFASNSVFTVWISGGKLYPTLYANTWKKV